MEESRSETQTGEPHAQTNRPTALIAFPEREQLKFQVPNVPGAPNDVSLSLIINFPDYRYIMYIEIISHLFPGTWADIVY